MRNNLLKNRSLSTKNFSPYYLTLTMFRCINWHEIKRLWTLECQVLAGMQCVEDGRE